MLTGKARGARMVSSHSSTDWVPRAPTIVASGRNSPASASRSRSVDGPGVPLEQGPELVVGGHGTLTARRPG